MEFQSSVAVTAFESRVAMQTKLSGEDVELMEENLEKSHEVMVVLENVLTKS